MIRHYYLLIAACLLSASASHAAEQSVSLAGLNVTVWSNQAAASGKQPVLIFSHGFHGCSTQSRFLMEAFADAGYLVFAPNHRDATCNGGSARWSERPAVSFGEPNNWSAATYRDRADDILNLIGAIRADEQWSARADLTRLGLAGHSLGGYTALGLGGAWPSWKLPSVKAVLALAPYSAPFIAHNSLGGLSIPVMYQAGSWDPAITPTVVRPGGVYDRSPAPKYCVELQRANHFAWTDLLTTDHRAIVDYSVAFMNHYILGEQADKLLTHAGAQVARLRLNSELGNSELR